MTVFLALLVMGILDVGRAIFTSIALADAAQEGVVYLAFTDEVAGSEVTETQVKNRVVSAISQPSLDPDADVTIWCVPISRADLDGASVQVIVEYQLPLVTPIFGPMMGGSFDLERQATGERLIGPPPSWCQPPP